MGVAAEKGLTGDRPYGRDSGPVKYTHKIAGDITEKIEEAIEEKTEAQE